MARTEIDTSVYANVKSGESRQLDGGHPPDYTANDDPTVWCRPPRDAAHEFSTGNFGTPGAPNDDCERIVQGMCDDGDALRPTVAPAPGDLVISSSTCKSVAPGAFALFARSADPALNGLLPAVDATFSFSLVDTNGNVEMRDGTSVLDTITWTSVSSAASKQLDPDRFTTIDNDLTANFCNGSSPYGDLSNSGTPRAENAQCP